MVYAILVALIITTPAFATGQSAQWQGCSVGAPTPSWATRDGSGCLVVPGGGSWGDITFQDHTYNEGDRVAEYGVPLAPGVDSGSTEVEGEQPAVNSEGGNPACDAALCDSSSCGDPECVGCNSVMWNNHIDNYGSLGKSPGPLSTGGTDDLIQYNVNSLLKHVLIKDTTLERPWVCTENSPMWSGLNGNACPASSTSYPPTCADAFHTNTLMAWGGGGPENGGWLVISDSSLLNSDREHLRLSEANATRGGAGGTACADSGPGGVLLQGVTIGQEAAFEADCRAHYSETCASFEDLACRDTQIAVWAESGSDWGDIWLVGVTNLGALFFWDGVMGNKVMIIGGSCEGGCYPDGGDDKGCCDEFPGPMTTNWASVGPGTACPNAKIGTMEDQNAQVASAAVPIYCYTSIENALADTYDAATCPDCPHERPPFIQLSKVGWDLLIDA